MENCFQLRKSSVSFWCQHSTSTLISVILFTLQFCSPINGQAHLSDQDVSETIAAFKTSDVSKRVMQFQKTLRDPNRREKLRPKVRRIILNEFGKIRIEDASAVRKIRKIIAPIMEFYDRKGFYEIFLLDHKSPYIMEHSGVALIITTGLILEAKTEDEILGFVAHEIGHEYFSIYTRLSEQLFVAVHKNGREKALSRHFAKILAILELQCDAFAALTLYHLGYNQRAFTEAAERFSGEFPADPEAYHPKSKVRRRFVEKLVPSKTSADRKQTGKLLKEVQSYLKYKLNDDF